MNIKFLDLSANYNLIREEVNMSIQKVLDKNNYILGEEVENFENNFANYCHSKYCIGLANGTDALEIALQSLELDKTSEVIIQGNTYIATCLGVVNNNYKLVLCDCHPETFQISIEDMKKKVTNKTKVIIVVHLYGLISNMDDICKFCYENNIILIEDAAQAHGAEWNGKKVGSFGKLSCFSFYPGKNLGAYGDGGAICTSDDELNTKIRMIRNNGSLIKYKHDIIGRNSRLDTIQAAILDVKLKYLESNNEKRRINANLYNSFLPKQIELPKVIEGSLPVYHLYVIKTDNREELSDYLKENMIDTLIHYPIPCSEQLALKKHHSDDPIMCRNLSNKILSLPMYPELTETEIKHICNLINQFFIQKESLIKLLHLKTPGKGGILNCINSFNFNTKRIFYIDNFSKNTESRGKHANKCCTEYIIVINGSIKIKLTNRENNSKIIYLSKNETTIIPPMIWIDFWSLQDNTILLVLCDEEFISDSKKSILNFNEFIN